MIIYYEVHQQAEINGEPVQEEMAAVDVTTMAANERAGILADLKTVYGGTCTYRRHDCGHDSGKLCTTEAI